MDDPRQGEDHHPVVRFDLGITMGNEGILSPDDSPNDCLPGKSKWIGELF